MSPAEAGENTSMNMVTTIMAFSVSAFFVLFVFIRLLCARLHLRAASPAADAFPTMERGIHGLEPTVVTSFPTLKFGDGLLRHPAQESQCTVCLEEYEEKDIMRVLPYCGHTFHATCIDIWLRQQSTCPHCRVSVRAPPHMKRAMPPAYAAAMRHFQSSTSSELSAFQAEAAAAHRSETAQEIVSVSEPVLCSESTTATIEVSVSKDGGSHCIEMARRDVDDASSGC